MRLSRLWFAAVLACALADTGCGPSHRDQKQSLETLIDTFEPIVSAVQRFERDHGTWPQALDDLVPNYLSAIPVGKLEGDAIKPQYVIDKSFWCIEAGGYVWKTFDGPIGEVQFRSDQQYDYATSPPVEDVGSYHGWKWVIWS